MWCANQINFITLFCTSQCFCQWTIPLDHWGDHKELPGNSLSRARLGGKRVLKEQAGANCVDPKHKFVVSIYLSTFMLGLFFPQLPGQCLVLCQLCRQDWEENKHWGMAVETQLTFRTLLLTMSTFHKAPRVV